VTSLVRAGGVARAGGGCRGGEGVGLGVEEVGDVLTPVLVVFESVGFVDARQRGVSNFVEGSGVRLVRSRSRSEAHALCVMTGSAREWVDKFGRWLILVNGGVSS
jgi:hypothetical protein